MKKDELIISDQNLCKLVCEKSNYTLRDDQICAYDPDSMKGSCSVCNDWNYHPISDEFIVKIIIFIGWLWWSFNSKWKTCGSYVLGKWLCKTWSSNCLHENNCICALDSCEHEVIIILLNWILNYLLSGLINASL